MNEMKMVPLRCPSCGNASNAPEAELRFGSQFTCAYCGTVSVLIINRQLYILAPGEHVCVKCGRVAPSNARFCQCGASMVRKCIFCDKGFPVDHNVCDYCGWPQDVDPSSEAGFKLKVQWAIRNLDSSDPDMFEKAKDLLRETAYGEASQALKAISSEVVPALVVLLRTSKNSAALIEACQTLWNIGPAASEAVPALADLLRTNKDSYVLRFACTALGSIGPAASEAVPALADLLQSSSDDEVLIAACGALIKIGSAASEAVPALVNLIQTLPWRVVFTEEINELTLWGFACEALAQIGPAASPAVPALIDLLRTTRNPHVVDRARKTLVAIATPEAIPVFADLLRKKEEKYSVLRAACDALEAIGEPALPALKSITGLFSGASAEAKKLAREAIARIEERRKQGWVS